MLGHIDLIDQKAVTSFLLDHTQHPIGGFGKYPDEPPDIYHSYLGLAILSILEYPGLKPIHPAACISFDALKVLSEG
jgi:geranylgeranyl transferase type-1 subunit beta